MSVCYVILRIGIAIALKLSRALSHLNSKTLEQIGQWECVICRFLNVWWCDQSSSVT